MNQKSFWLMSSSLISSEDTKTLALLYQPLIGTNSFGVYLMMINLIDKTKLQTDIYPLQMLFDLLDMNQEIFNSCINKLEAIGLLTTYKKDDIYLFRLNMPLRARQFFLDGILGSFLKSEVGEDNFNLLFNEFSVPEISKKGYKNITKSFDDVYSVKPFDAIKSEKFILGRKNGGGIIIKDAFDFDSLFEILPIRLKKRRLYTKGVLSQIASVMYVYNFSSQEIISILSKAYDEQHTKFFSERIALISREYFQQEYGKNMIEVEKKQTSQAEVDLSSIRPQDIITLFGQKMTNQSFALDTIRQFIDRNPVDIGLINAVILVSLKYNDQLPSLNYLEKVLADWTSRGIKTGLEALPILSQAEKKRAVITDKRKKPGIGGEEPAWLDEIIASLWEDELK